jgi:hypothetical protein
MPLYRLCQAPHVWNAKLNTGLVGLGFTWCITEHGLYTQIKNDIGLVVGAYIDDLPIVSECMMEIELFKGKMKQTFGISDLGSLSYYLGIEVKQG